MSEVNSDRLLTLIVGCVLVVSLLFSPGMLPAERPSHLYLNLIPLCLGCSMISMKGFPVELWRSKMVEGEEKRERERVCECQKDSE